MDFEAARAAIYTKVSDVLSASPTTKVEYENRSQVDLASQIAPWVGVSIHFTDGEQIDLGETPSGRYYGAIYLGVFIRQGEGTAAGQTLLSTLADGLKVQVFSGVKTQWPRPLPGIDNPPGTQGWHRLTLRVPFYFDDVA